jgi:hypothetical protein
LSVVGQSDEVIKSETFCCCGWKKVMASCRTRDSKGNEVSRGVENVGS